MRTGRLADHRDVGGAAEPGPQEDGRHHLAVEALVLVSRARPAVRDLPHHRLETRVEHAPVLLQEVTCRHHRRVDITPDITAVWTSPPDISTDIIPKWTSPPCGHHRDITAVWTSPPDISTDIIPNWTSVRTSPSSGHHRHVDITAGHQYGHHPQVDITTKWTSP